MATPSPLTWPESASVVASDPELSLSAEEAVPSPPEPRRQPTVLVVDDDELVRRMLETALRRNDLEVLGASSGFEAIKLFQDHRQLIDLVLLDVRMPELDGPATLRQLRTFDQDVRCCFMTGDFGEHSEESLRQQGALQVFLKPFVLAELIQQLRALAGVQPA